MSVEIRRSSARFADRGEGRLTQHAFSFGPHYDAERLALGPMVCHDDHLLGSGQGFDTHHHSDLEIVSWVVSGALVHRHGGGEPQVLRAGSVAHLSAGDGVEHSEHASSEGPCRFVQVWLRPRVALGSEADAGAPSYAVHEVAAERGRLVPALSVGGSTFHVATLEDGDELALPAAGLLHVFLATGALQRSSLAEPLAGGDAFVMTDEPAHTVTATVPTQLLVWSLSTS